MLTDGSERARYITGLRDLADYLTDHPGAPVPRHRTEINVFPPNGSEAEERAYVDQAATALDVTAEDDRGHYQACRSFGPLAYNVLTISTEARARYQAAMSYYGHVTPAPSADGAAPAAATVA
jgi:hypothetical protein